MHDDDFEHRAERAVIVLENFERQFRPRARFIPGSGLAAVVAAAERREQRRALPVRTRVWWWTHLRAVRTVRAFFL
jgi:hypothetical protein